MLKTTLAHHPPTHIPHNPLRSTFPPLREEVLYSEPGASGITPCVMISLPGHTEALTSLYTIHFTSSQDENEKCKNVTALCGEKLLRNCYDLAVILIELFVQVNGLRRRPLSWLSDLLRIRMGVSVRTSVVDKLCLVNIHIWLFLRKVISIITKIPKTNDVWVKCLFFKT